MTEKESDTTNQRHYHVIINPASRSGGGNSVWQTLEAVLKEQQASYTAHFTEKQGDAAAFAEELTKSAADRVTLLVMGGDGTLNEVLQGIADFSRTDFFYLPLGSGNDFARDYPQKGTAQARLLNLLKNPTPYLVDIGIADYVTADGTKKTRRFAVSSGIGYDAAVCAQVEASAWKPFFNNLGLGKLIYLFEALKMLFQIPRCAIEVCLAGGQIVRQSSFFLCAGMNQRHEGGGFRFAPGADASDGLLDLCLVEQLPILKLLRVLPTAFKGRHVKYKEVHMYRAGYIRIRTRKPMDIHCDGEVMGKGREVVLTCNRQALHLYL